jgi:hypothetical protein
MNIKLKTKELVKADRLASNDNYVYLELLSVRYNFQQWVGKVNYYYEKEVTIEGNTKIEQVILKSIDMDFSNEEMANLQVDLGATGSNINELIKDLFKKTVNYQLDNNDEIDFVSSDFELVE